LKFKRKNYQDQKKARGISVAVALIIAALLKYTIEYRFILYLLQYLVPAFGFVAIMLNRSLLIKLLIDALEYFTNLYVKWSSLLTAIC
jgi:hypothetical protein